MALSAEDEIHASTDGLSNDEAHPTTMGVATPLKEYIHRQTQQSSRTDLDTATLGRCLEHLQFLVHHHGVPMEELDRHWQFYLHICAFYQRPIEVLLFYEVWLQQTNLHIAAVEIAKRGDVHLLQVLNHFFPAVIEEYHWVDFLNLTIPPQQYSNLFQSLDLANLRKHILQRYQLTGQLQDWIDCLEQASQAGSLFQALIDELIEIHGNCAYDGVNVHLDNGMGNASAQRELRETKELELDVTESGSLMVSQETSNTSDCLNGDGHDVFKEETLHPFASQGGPEPPQAPLEKANLDAVVSCSIVEDSTTGLECNSKTCDCLDPSIADQSHVNATTATLSSLQEAVEKPVEPLPSCESGSRTDLMVQPLGHRMSPSEDETAMHLNEKYGEEGAGFEAAKEPGLTPEHVQCPNGSSLQNEQTEEDIKSPLEMPSSSKEALGSEVSLESAGQTLEPSRHAPPVTIEGERNPLRIGQTDEEILMSPVDMSLAFQATEEDEADSEEESKQSKELLQQHVHPADNVYVRILPSTTPTEERAFFAGQNITSDANLQHALAEPAQQQSSPSEASIPKSAEQNSSFSPFQTETTNTAETTGFARGRGADPLQILGGLGDSEASHQDYTIDLKGEETEESRQGTRTKGDLTLLHTEFHPADEIDTCLEVLEQQIQFMSSKSTKADKDKREKHKRRDVRKKMSRNWKILRKRIESMHAEFQAAKEDFQLQETADAARIDFLENMLFDNLPEDVPRTPPRVGSRDVRLSPRLGTPSVMSMNSPSHNEVDSQVSAESIRRLACALEMSEVQRSRTLEELRLERELHARKLKDLQVAFAKYVSLQKGEGNIASTEPASTEQSQNQFGSQ